MPTACTGLCAIPGVSIGASLAMLASELEIWLLKVLVHGHLLQITLRQRKATNFHVTRMAATVCHQRAMVHHPARRMKMWSPSRMAELSVQQSAQLIQTVPWIFLSTLMPQHIALPKASKAAIVDSSVEDWEAALKAPNASSQVYFL